LYCVRAEGGAEVGEGRVVAVYSRVGRGVSLGGSGVKVETRVGVLDGASVPAMGWNGVEVGEASGGTVTITSVGGAATEVCREQALRNQPKTRSVSRREFFIKIFVIARGVREAVCPKQSQTVYEIASLAWSRRLLDQRSLAMTVP
jgi:hypothetical protein